MAHHIRPRTPRRTLIGGAVLGAACLLVPLLAPVHAVAAPTAAGTATSALLTTSDQNVATAKVRTIVTTDPELDDLNSLLRMLLYSNEINIDGLIYSSSQHHFEGDPATGVAPFRWPDPASVFHIDDAVNQYEKAYPNLRVHDAAFPTPDELRAKILWGNVKTKGDMAEETDGSRYIEAAILDDRPGQLFLEAWGGPNTIARALKSIQEDFEGTAGWAAVQQKVYDKVVLTSWGQQDDTFRDYIRPNWPKLDQREVSTSIWGYFARGSALPQWQTYLSPEWMKANVSDVGPMGASYRVWGDGKQMAAGFDNEDFFGQAGYTAEELTAMGYLVWTAPQPKGAWISEGDSSNFALLIQNGLRNWQDPTFGGWGGRQAINPDDPYQWRNSGVTDIGPDGQPRADYSAGRWFEDFQLDLAARLQWTVTPKYADANHEPNVQVASGLDVSLAAGETAIIDASAADPDSDALTVKWSQYREAGTYPGAATVKNLSKLRTTFTVPADAAPGSTIHLLLEVADSGAPSLTSWQRVIVTVAAKASVDVDFALTGVKRNGTVVLTGSAVNEGSADVTLSAATRFGKVPLGVLKAGATKKFTVNTWLPRVPAGSIRITATAATGVAETYTVKFRGVR